MKRQRLLRLFVCILILCTLMSVGVHADIGPKPSVRVYLDGIPSGECYATLLSLRSSTGPSSAWDGTPESANHAGNENYSWSGLSEETWRAFVDYTDPDGYYFLQEGWRVDGTGEFAWTYYPPSSFKILLYFPESGSFLASPILERYAFHSVFAASPTPDGASLSVARSYDYGPELFSLAVRILLTLLLEFAVAFLFGFRKKREFFFLALLNAITQAGLNLALSAIDYAMGYFAFVFFYALLELLVFLTEGILCALLRKRFEEKPRRTGFYFLYSLAANAASFGFGLWLARLLPGIF